MENSHDVVVVGGGIVGLATARALVRRGIRDVVVLEAEDRIASHQTGRNSGVVHSGLYYKPGSLKALNCTAGREAMYRYCEEQGVPHRRSGKVVVATDRSELPRLQELERRGRANGLEGIRLLDGMELKELEPEVDAVCGLWVPQAGLVDYGAVAAAFAREVVDAGGAIRTGSRVEAVRESGSGAEVITRAGDIRAATLVNCGGLQSDRIARMCGVEPGVRIVPFRGEYHELVPEARALVRNPIYPVPDPAFPFLGVHLTPTIDGRVEAGPNAVLAMKREGYRRRDVSLRDMRDTLGYRGFHRLARRHWRSGLAEVARSHSIRLFVRDLQRLVPRLTRAHLAGERAGVRAQAVDRNGNLVDDFLIMHGTRSVHVLNAPSPAATASISIGERIAARILEASHVAAAR